jgi:hypothetical protein
MWRVKLGRTSGHLPWACILLLVPAPALAVLLIVGYVRPGSDQVNQFAPTPSRWYLVLRPGDIYVYHFGDTVPDSAVPSFAWMNRHGGARARGELVLGESHASPALNGVTQTGYVHQGGGSRSATPFTFWSVGLWRPFLLSLLLLLPAARGLRRWRARLRHAAGLCPQCGYDLTGNLSGVCPECGTAAGAAARGA